MGTHRHAEDSRGLTRSRFSVSIWASLPSGLGVGFSTVCKLTSTPPTSHQQRVDDLFQQSSSYRPIKCSSTRTTHTRVARSPPTSWYGIVSPEVSVGSCCVSIVTHRLTVCHLKTGAVMAARPMFINMRPQWACESRCQSRLQ